jgi:hypothetical protein
MSQRAALRPPTARAAAAMLHTGNARQRDMNQLPACCD